LSHPTFCNGKGIMSDEIEFSDHSLLKIEILKAHGVNVSKELIEEAIRSPDRIDRGHKGRSIAQRRLDEEHVIRVVYDTGMEKIHVVTVYPERRLRYEKDQI